MLVDQAANSSIRQNAMNSRLGNTTTFREYQMEATCVGGESTSGSLNVQASKDCHQAVGSCTLKREAEA